MPNTSLQDAIKEAYTVAPSDVIIFNTIEIRQVGVQDSVFLVKSKSPLIAYDDDSGELTFLPANFDFTLPPQNEEGFVSLNIAIDNINRVASDFVDRARSTKVPVEIIYRPYLSTDLSAPQMNPPLVLYLRDIQVTAMQVVGRATFMDVVNKKFPSELYTRARFPALG